MHSDGRCIKINWKFSRWNSNEFSTNTQLFTIHCCRRQDRIRNLTSTRRRSILSQRWGCVLGQWKWIFEIKSVSQNQLLDDRLNGMLENASKENGFFTWKLLSMCLMCEIQLYSKTPYWRVECVILRQSVKLLLLFKLWCDLIVYFFLLVLCLSEKTFSILWKKTLK